MLSGTNGRPPCTNLALEPIGAGSTPEGGATASEGGADDFQGLQMALDDPNRPLNRCPALRRELAREAGNNRLPDLWRTVFQGLAY